MAARHRCKRRRVSKPPRMILDNDTQLENRASAMLVKHAVKEAELVDLLDEEALAILVDALCLKHIRAAHLHNRKGKRNGKES